MFKSVLGHCAMWNILIWLFFILFSGGLSSDSPIPTYNPGLGSSLETAPQIHAMRLDDSLNSYTVSKNGGKFKFNQNSKINHKKSGEIGTVWNLCFLFQVSRDASHSPTAFMMDLDEMPRFQTKTSDTLTMTPAGHFHQRFV